MLIDVSPVVVCIAAATLVGGSGELVALEVTEVHPLNPRVLATSVVAKAPAARREFNKVTTTYVRDCFLVYPEGCL
ncbi:hypothetical protein KaCgl_24200 [Corynebacterium glutamicum]|nr:hypothetical protein KaCgl_24200 [Corynebacterium glutamicum]GFK18039.1 hypothetical protein KbCgl_06110 [Corynebacterium glutamicum]